MALTLLLLAQGPPQLRAAVPLYERGKGFKLSWAPQEGVSGWEVWRDGSKLASLGPSETQFVDEEASFGEHAYRLVALYPDTQLAQEFKVKPVKLKVKALWSAFGLSGMEVAWYKDLPGKVQIIRNGEPIITLPPGQNSYLDHGGKPGDRYLVKSLQTGETLEPHVMAVRRTVSFRGYELALPVGGKVEVYRVQDGELVPVGEGEGKLVDGSVKHTAVVGYLLRRGNEFYFSQKVLPGWFDVAKTPVLVFDVIYAAAFFLFLLFARSGRPMFIRKIAGLEELDNAVGRSTEMGKPILFVPGLGYISDLPTISALTILKHVAKKAAEYETRIIVPNSDPFVMVAAKEVVKEAYTEAGRPDLYNDDDVFFLTRMQFAYAAGVDGIMLRQRPGAVFHMGLFYAESLILAETGFSVGAIQVAGTSSVDQLPFFIAACDYTLIGEELYAASAYLSRNALQIATLKAEDVFKVAMAAAAVIMSVAAGLGLKFLLGGGA